MRLVSLTGALTAVLVFTVLCGPIPLAGSAPSPSPRQEANDRAAARRAAGDLRAFRLPPGSRRLRHVPPPLSEPAKFLRVRGATHLHRFWLVPRGDKAFFDWLDRHPPAGLRPPSEGGFTTGFFDESVEVPQTWEEWSGPAAPAVLKSVATVTTAPRGPHSTAVRIDAVADPVRARPRVEQVPAAVTKIRLKIEYHQDAGGPIVEEGEFPVVPPSNEGEVRSLTIRGPQRVDQIVRLVDGLRIVQPAGPSEEIPVPEEEVLAPGMPLSSTVHLLFESESGRVLAEASRREGADGDPMRFAVRGRAMAPLEGGRRVLRALIPERRRAVRTRLPKALRPPFP